MAATPEERLEGGSTADDDPRYYAPNYYVGDEDTHAPASSGDSDLGEQVILRPQWKRAPLKVRAETHLFWSDNIGADSSDPDDGWFFVGSLGARWKQRLGENLFLDAFAYQDAYLYDSEGLDFESSELGIGLIRNLPDLADITVYSRYEFLYVNADDPGFPLTSADDHLTNRFHRIRLGAYKTLYQTSEHSVTLSTQARIDLDATPSRLERRQYAARLGYYRRLTNRLQFSAYAKTSFREYRHSSRRDWYSYGGLDLNYRLGEHAKLYASILYGRNDSNRPGGLSDYEAWQAGLGLGLHAKF
ncbi:MAG: hypothetical protein HKN82_18010 [Akkermansiaceae bacterium]|nr:hypothetical protein [Akkermansiaceae bacterium]